MRRMIFAVFLLCFIQTYAKSPDIPEALWNAKTAYVQNSGSSTEKDYAKLCEALKKWGRFELVQDKTSADIYIILYSAAETQQMRMPGVTAGLTSDMQVIINSIRILNTKDGALLWTDKSPADNNDPKILVSKLKSKMKKKE